MEEYFASLKCKVEIRDGRGKGLFAVEDIPEGSTILKSRTYGSILHPHLWSIQCFHCFARLIKGHSEQIDLGPVKYCSSICHEKDPHRTFESPDMLSKLRLEVNDAFVSDLLLLARVLRKATTQDSLKQHFATNAIIQPTFKDVQGMVCHENVTAVPYHKIITRLRDDCVELVPKECLANKTTEELVQMLNRFGCNNFSVTDKLMTSIAACVSPFGAILNHDCIPNCVVTYRFEEGGGDEGIVQYFRTVRSVKAGEELCHSYLDAASSRQMRLQKLKENYSFDCSCRRCVDTKDLQLYVGMPNGLIEELCSALNTAGATEEQISYFRREAFSRPVDLESSLVGDIGSKPIASGEPANRRRDLELTLANKLMQEAATEEDAGRELNLLLQAKGTKAKYLHPLNLENLEVTNNIYTVALLSGHFELAIQAGMRAIDVYRCIYQYCNPLIGLTAYSVGSLLCESDKKEQSLQYLQFADEALTLTHGGSSTLVLELRDYITGVKQDVEALQKGSH